MDSRRTVLSVYDTAMQVSRANVLSEKDRHAVIQGMGAVVSRLPPDRAAAGLLRLLQPAVAELDAALRANTRLRQVVSSAKAVADENVRMASAIEELKKKVMDHRKVRKDH